MLFASAGYEVKLFDTDLQVVAGALDDILVQLQKLSSDGILRGQLSVTEQHQRITGAETLADCISGAIFVEVRMQHFEPVNCTYSQHLFTPYVSWWQWWHKASWCPANVLVAAFPPDSSQPP